jgi:hypothetical protein
MLNALSVKALIIAGMDRKDSALQIVNGALRTADSLGLIKAKTVLLNAKKEILLAKGDNDAAAEVTKRLLILSDREKQMCSVNNELELVMKNYRLKRETEKLIPLQTQMITMRKFVILSFLIIVILMALLTVEKARI